jgi:hypothetical protein
VAAGDVLKKNYDGEDRWRMADCDNNNLSADRQVEMAKSNCLKIKYNFS